MGNGDGFTVCFMLRKGGEWEKEVRRGRFEKSNVVSIFVDKGQ